MATFIPNITDIFPEPKYFTPDFGYIDKMLKRKEAMYLEGFSKLNNEYNFINRKLTHTANIESRDKFLNEAKENLKNLSAMDLSDMSNVKAAGEVFKPFYGNKVILGDQAFTSFVDGQEAMGNSLRLKDGGKEFSENNLKYVQMQREQFAKDTPDSVFEYMQNKKSFTPWYDWHKEVQEKMKDFKPTHTKYDKLNGLYKVTIENESWTNEEIAKYLNATLSDKAKQQMRIDGYVTYGNNPEALKTQYIEKQRAALPEINNYINNIDQQLKVEKDPQKRAQLSETKEYLSNKRAETTNIIRNIEQADPKFIQRNAESLAYQLHYSDMIEKTANGYAHKDVSQTIGADDVALAIWKDQQDWARERYRASKEDQRLLSILGPTLNNVVSVQGKTEDMDVNQLLSNVSAQKDNYTRAYDDVLTMVSQYYDVDKSKVTQAMFSKYISTNKNSPVVLQMFEANTNYETAVESQKSYEKQREVYARDKIGRTAYDNLGKFTKAFDYYKNIMAGGRTVSIGGVRYNTPEEAASASIGYSYSTIKEALSNLNSFREYYSREGKVKVTTSRPGFVMSTESDDAKNTMSLIGGNFIDKENLSGGLMYYPNADQSKYDIGIPLKDKLRGKSTEIEAIVNTLKANKPEIKWQYNEATHSILAPGLGSQVAPQLDPFRNIPPADRFRLSVIENAVLDPGETSPDILFHKLDKTGNIHNFSIRKYMAHSGKTYYQILVDNNIIPSVEIPTSHGAYRSIMDVFSNNDIKSLIDAEINKK